VKFKANNKGFYDVRRMPKLVDLLEEKAEKIAAEANSNLSNPGDHYRTGSRQGARRPQGRWRTSVFTATEYAKRADAKHNLLLKALY
jgi:hypothetical protein